MAKSIKINVKEKSTTIRLSESTKLMLESLERGKETHDEIVQRLIKTANAVSKDYGTQLITQGNVSVTKYERLHKTFNIELDDHKYSVVSTYNDLSLFFLVNANKRTPNFPADEWEVELDMVSLNKDNDGWRQTPPMWDKNIGNDKKKEYLLLYLIILKKILEEVFDIRFYSLVKKEDYFSYDNWREAYKINNLSHVSFTKDVEIKLQGRE